MDNSVILMNFGKVDLLRHFTSPPVNEDNSVYVGTIVSNLAHYGYIPSKALYQNLLSLSEADLVSFWKEAQKNLSSISKEDRNMGEHVVYKNFPKEVLDKTQSEYWMAQILMYWGVPNELLTEDKEERGSFFEDKKMKVLDNARLDEISSIRDSLILKKNAWTDLEKDIFRAIFHNTQYFFRVSEFGFKDNAISAVAQRIREGNANFKIENSTDVLRLAAFLANSNCSIKRGVKFGSLVRSDRKMLLNLLESVENSIIDDVAMRKDVWKSFFRRVHPGDYNFPNVSAAYDELYNKRVASEESIIESMIKSRDSGVFNILTRKPGVFMRRLHKLYSVFGRDAFAHFLANTKNLNTRQLLNISKYFETINGRNFLAIAPNGNWDKLQVVKNEKRRILDSDLDYFISEIKSEIGSRLNALYPAGYAVDKSVKDVNLPSNSQELATYGVGTKFPIPKKVKFIRTASYWKFPSTSNIWYDNGWNFFSEDWKPIDTVCWSSNRLGDAAIFSGDPTNVKSATGEACQMIDIYPEKLLELGVRYAVWNVLGYSHKNFSEAYEVLATLQMGEEPQKNKLYEPNRVSMAFPLVGENKSKYVAYIDLVEREIVYMDANLSADVHSAKSNEYVMSQRMPALVEYMRSIPSVYDLFSCGKSGDIPVVYSDSDLEIKGDAYVFEKNNADNRIDELDINKILSYEKPDNDGIMIDASKFNFP